MYAENMTIEDKTVFLDGATIHNCELRRCKLVFSGYLNYSLTHCKFEECTWAFNGPASTVLQFLRSMNKMGANEMVQHVVKAILDNEAIPGVAEDVE